MSLSERNSVKITKEQIESAREMDLLTYLKLHEPDNLKKMSSNEYRLIDHDSLKISNGKWNWFSRGIGGRTALDYLILVRGVEFKEAVGIINGYGTVAYSFPAKEEKKESAESKEKKLMLPARNENEDYVKAYLRSRLIDPDIIKFCIAKNMLYESKRTHRCIFVGYSKDQKMLYASERGVANNIKKDIAGSDKRYCFSIPASEEKQIKELSVFESPIDLLSHATMSKIGIIEGKPQHRLALGGISPLAMEQYLKDHPEIEKVNICLDNDDPGQETAARFKTLLENKGYKVTINLPPAEVRKDYNDWLKKELKSNNIKRERGEMCHDR